MRLQGILWMGIAVVVGGIGAVHSEERAAQQPGPRTFAIETFVGPSLQLP